MRQTSHLFMFSCKCNEPGLDPMILAMKACPETLTDHSSSSGGRVGLLEHILIWCSSFSLVAGLHKPAEIIQLLISLNTIISEHRLDQA